MLWTRKTQRHRHQWFVQAHSRLQIFTVMLGSSPRLGMALAGTALEFRAGDFITSCKTSCGCALWLDCPAVNQFIYVTSQLRYVCTSCPEGRKENRKDKGRKMSAGSSRKSTEKRCFFLWIYGFRNLRWWWERLFPVVLLLFAPTHMLGEFLFPIGSPKAWAFIFCLH